MRNEMNQASVTAGASNAKGSYTQIIAATSFDYEAISVYATASFAAANSALMDLAIGAGGSEVVVIPNMAASWPTTTSRGKYLLYPFPFRIPKGTRIAIRGQNGQGSTQAITCYVNGFNRWMGKGAFQRMIDIGMDTSVSAPIVVTPGNGSKGSYAQLVASLAAPIRAFHLCAIPGTGNLRHQIDVAIGAGGSEQIIAADLLTESIASGDDFYPQLAIMLDSVIPAGTRMAVRAQSSSTSAFRCGLLGGVPC